jgi:diaminopimelate epimerase
MGGGIAFAKYEGLGNDFVVIDVERETDVPPSVATALCDRHYGVGADGVLLVLPPRHHECEARMRVVNADGSVPEMCGNGLRCVALHVARARDPVAKAVHIDTDAGPRRCVVEGGRDAAIVTVDMGVVRVTGDLTIDLGDAGNPHIVLLGTFAPAEVDRLGPRLAVHPAFPQGTNVEFARVAGGRVDLVVWERGVGRTLACGTGACAAAAVACAKGIATPDTPVAVRLPGGPLDVTIASGGRATLRGPARRVFAGVFEGSAATTA